ncbi:hypothetical protein, partial [Paracoccus sp. (in: a-proteobacteria)]|uniref:hypothetical protein n=1 Tax=Paracoccus sp. TaxID=267 RepID=UPI0026E040D2
TAHDVAAGGVLVTQGILPGAAMQARGRLVAPRRTVWTGWTDFVAPDIRIEPSDFSETLQQKLAQDRAIADQAAATAADAQQRAITLRTDLDAAVKGLGDDVDDLLGKIDTARRDARDYTDNGIRDVTVELQSEFGQIQARIDEITAAALSGNLISNGDFADGLTGWTHGTATVTDGQAHVATRLGQEFDVVFTPGEMLQWRLDYQGDGASVRVQFYDADGATIGTERLAARLPDTAEMRTGSGQLTPPEGVGKARWRVFSNNPLVIDNVAVTRIDQQLLARIQKIEAAKLADDQAMTIYKQNIVSRFEKAESAITAEATTRSNANTALSTRLNTVSATVNTKPSIFRQAQAPEAEGRVTGDLWIDTNGNTMHRWSGSAWVDVTDTSLKSRNRSFWGRAVPDRDDLVTGDLWVRIPDNRLHRWSVDRWVEVQDKDLTDTTAKVTTQETAIADLKKGAKAGFLVRAQAGNQVSLLDMIAADGSGKTPSSYAKLRATELLLEGNTIMDKALIGSGRNEIQNAD